MYGANHEYDLEINTARRLAASGRGVLTSPDIDLEVVPEKVVSKEVAVEKVLEATRDVPKGPSLPLKFPERGLLIEAGFGTIESLRTTGAVDALTKVQGLTKGKINKIGLALEKLD